MKEGVSGLRWKRILVWYTSFGDTVTTPSFFNGKLVEISYDQSEGSVVAFAWWDWGKVIKTSEKPVSRLCSPQHAEMLTIWFK